MSKLSFDEFSKANEARKKQFFKGSSVDNWSIADAFMAMIGELGETANALKKVRRAELGMLNKNAEGRQIDTLDEAKAQIAGEIGGFMCYLDQLCVQIGLRLEDCIVNEFNKKSAELGLPERLFAEPVKFTEEDFNQLLERYRETDKLRVAALEENARLRQRLGENSVASVPKQASDEIMVELNKMTTTQKAEFMEFLIRSTCVS